MSGWPWPLNGVQGWFESLWNWISTAAVNAVSRVFGWIRDAVGGLWNSITGALSGLWTSISGAFGSLWTSIVGAVGNLWNSISSGISGLWTGITTAFSNIWTSVSGVLANIWMGLVEFISNFWNSISTGISGLWTSISGAVGGLWTSVSGALGNLWTGFVSFVSSVADGVHQGINAVGSAVGSAVNTIGSWVSEALKGVAGALGTALSNFVSGIGTALQNVGGAIVGFVSENIITPLLGALNWIRDAMYNILRSLWSSIEGVLGGHSPITPESAAGLTIPLLLIGAGAGFSISVMGAIGATKVLGSGIEAQVIPDVMERALALSNISRSVVGPYFNATYEQPIRFYYNSIFRPAILDTRTADDLYWHGDIDLEQRKQVYRYHGWKEPDIEGWIKTEHSHPRAYTLISMLLDPDTPEDWVRRHLKEEHWLDEDIEQVIAYKRRQATSDERSALATADLADFVDGAIDEAIFTADLAALRFSQAEIDYRVAKAYLFIDRNAKKAAATAAKAAKPKAKFLSESDLEKELELGLRTPDQYIQDLMSLDYTEDIARRKLALEMTPRPVSAAEITRRKTLIENKIAAAKRRYDMQIARQDLQTGMISDMIEYLSSLEKPPATRIESLKLQLNKAAGEKQLIIQDRDAELAELAEELKLVQAG